MMKYLLLIFACCFFTITSKAQNEKSVVKAENDDKKDISAIIEKLFDGMRLGDSSMVSQCFYTEVEMFTSFTDKKGNPQLVKGDLPKFLEAIGTPHEEIWDEIIWDTEVKIDGNLAQVWTHYAFYVGEKFSHCGVDAFHLTRTKEGWKIFHLADTRQREGCKNPREK